MNGVVTLENESANDLVSGKLETNEIEVDRLTVL